MRDKSFLAYNVDQHSLGKEVFSYTQNWFMTAKNFIVHKATTKGDLQKLKVHQYKSVC